MGMAAQLRLSASLPLLKFVAGRGHRQQFLLMLS